MTQEDKELLLKDLCARLPYDVIVVDHYGFVVLFTWKQMKDFEDGYISKPFLRPMSSMTKEEKHIILELFNDKYVFVTNEGINADDQLTPVWKPFGLQGIRFKTMSKIIDWLNKNMFDYNGLIPMGLAIAITEENNPYKE